jgi:aspartate aminotransferase-like enzyme
MMSERALARVNETQSSSFACDLKKWLQIMQAYEQGGHAYHATLPCDALARFRDVMLETQAYGFEKIRDQQLELGQRVRTLLSEKGFNSVAAAGFQAPGVVVCYTEDAGFKTGQKFAAQGLQIAAGVPLQCDEPADFQTFRIGLFGLEKLQNIQRTVSTLEQALSKIEQA